MATESIASLHPRISKIIMGTQLISDEDWPIMQAFLSACSVSAVYIIHYGGMEKMNARNHSEAASHAENRQAEAVAQGNQDSINWRVFLTSY